jgi:hypothetical protein
MEQQNQTQDSELFSLTIDPIGRGHLIETAKWARFLAIVGFVCITIFALIAIFAGSYITTMFSKAGPYNELGSDFTAGMTITFIIFYICVALIVFLAYLFLYRFAVNMRGALRENSQDLLNRSFQNLKILYRYWGILTLIGIALYAIFFLFAIIGRAI